MPHEYAETSYVDSLQPETVAAYLVPRVRTVVARKSLSTYIKYLTIPRALGKFLTAPTKANKYFDKQGTHRTLLFTPGLLWHTSLSPSCSVPTCGSIPSSQSMCKATEGGICPSSRFFSLALAFEL